MVVNLKNGLAWVLTKYFVNSVQPNETLVKEKKRVAT
jgi:hypothetical protein